jgi:hypothetical protein
MHRAHGTILNYFSKYLFGIYLLIDSVSLFAYQLLVHDPWFTSTQKTNDRATPTPLKLGTISGVAER